MKRITYISLAALTLAAAACSGPKGWSVEGTCGAADGTKIALEGYNNGIWYLVDSLAVGKDGKFEYRADAPATYPEIMRLTGAGFASPVFFPVDGTDAVKVRDGKAAGTPMAVEMSRIDSLVAAAGSRLGNAAAADPELRRELAQAAIADSSSIIAYYVLNKSVGGRTVFDPADAFGNRIYGAVAQNFATHRPDDPRGAIIKAVYLEGRKALGKGGVQTTEIEVPAAGVIDIVRYDDLGTSHSLRDLASQGKVIVLNFTAYQSDFSPALSVILNEAYEKYHAQGLEIYQLAFDRDDVQWKESARNLPWITVYNAPTDGLNVLSAYNVAALPATFVIDRKGDIVARVDDPNRLGAELAKLF